MEYIFESMIDLIKKSVTIPFNVWEVCEDNIGEVPVHVTLAEHTFDCKLEPIKNGYYEIPIDDKIIRNLRDNTFYPVSFTIIGKDGNEKVKESSPYSKSHPIRTIDSMNILIQPWDGLCGQTVFAMIAGIDIEEASNIMHCREWQANMAKIVESLDYVGIGHSNQIIYTRGKDIELPKCCIIMEYLGRYSHYLVGYDGKFYDPNNGITATIDKANIKGYMEIYCD